MKRQQSIKKLSKFLCYVLGRRPDEFGLVPDQDGFVKIKELLQALHEEEGWRHISRSAVNELLAALKEPGIEIKDNVIRASDRSHLKKYQLTHEIPKLLFTCVRRKAYSNMAEKGITPSSFSQVILSANQALAMKIGRRKDREPVLLTVQVGKAIDKGIIFSKSGDLLYLAKIIPPDCFLGPPLPKETPDAENKAPKKETVVPTPGSFTIDPFHEKKMPNHSGKKGKKGEITWKKERKRWQKEKRKKRKQFDKQF